MILVDAREGGENGEGDEARLYILSVMERKGQQYISLPYREMTLITNSENNVTDTGLERRGSKVLYS